MSNKSVQKPNLSSSDRIIAVGFASPPLGFLLFVIIPTVQKLPDLKAALYLGLIVVFIVAYLLGWLCFDAVKDELDRNKKTVYILLFAALTLVISWYPSYFYPFYYLYLGWTVILLSPTRYYRSLLAGYILVVLSSYFIWGYQQSVDYGLLVISGILLIPNALYAAFVRRQIIQSMLENQQQILERIELVKAERARMASDLHDQLGQTLTAINMNAQMASALLKQQKVAQFAQEIGTIESLSRQALREMREVIWKSSRLNIAEELNRAKELLESRGIRVTLRYHWEDHALAEEAEDVIGHLIRECSTNILKHSTAKHCWISILPQQVAVINDGANPHTAGNLGRATDESGGGDTSDSPMAVKNLVSLPQNKSTGLANLGRRCAKIGVLESGHSSAHPDRWEVKLILK